MVILTFFSNDISDTALLKEIRENGEIVRQELTGNKIISGHLVTNSAFYKIKFWFHNHSALYRKISERIHIIKRNLNKEKVLLPYYLKEKTPWPEDVVYRRTIQSIINISELLAEKNVKLNIVYIPTGYQVEKKYSQFFYGLYPGLEDWDRIYDVKQPQTFLKEQLAEKGIEIFDPTDFLRQAESSHGGLYFRYDQHFTPQGHKVFASYLKSLI